MPLTVNITDGSLVIVKKKDINSLKTNDEIFVYQSDKEGKVFINVRNIKEVNIDDDYSYITLKNEDGVYTDDLIVGKISKKINLIGKIIEFISKKWVFFIIIILPCSLLAIYELYYLFRYLIVGENKETLEL